MPDEDPLAYGGFDPEQYNQPAEPEQELNQPSSDAYFDPFTSFGGGLDSLRNSTEKKMASTQKAYNKEIARYRQQAQFTPTYQFGGQITNQKPTGPYVMRIGEEEGVETPEFQVPLQEQRARQLEQERDSEIQRLRGQIPTDENGNVIDNLWVLKNRKQIYQGLVAGNDGKPIDMESFVDNPYWDRFSNLTETGKINLLKSLLPSVKAMSHQHTVLDELNNQWSKVWHNAVQSDLYNKLPEDGKEVIYNVLNGRNNNVDYARKELLKIQQKSQVLNDPYFKAIYDEIQTNPDLVKYKQALMASTGASQFESILARVAQNKEKIANLRDEMTDKFGIKIKEKIGEISTETTEQVRSIIDKAINQDGLLDKEPRMIENIIRDVSSNPGTEETMPDGSKKSFVTVDLHDRKGNPVQVKVPSLYQYSEEFKFEKQLAEKGKEGYRYFDKYGNLIKDTEVQKYLMDEAKLAFPRSGENENGQYVHFKRQNIFKNPQDHEIYPEGTILMPDGSMYVRRDVMKELNVTEDDMVNLNRSDKDQNHTDELVFSENKMKWFKPDAEEFKAPLMTVAEFEGGNPGEKFKNKKEFLAAMENNQRKVLAKASTTGSPIALLIEKHGKPTEAAGWGEVITKGLARGFSGMFLKSFMMPFQVASEAANVAMGAGYDEPNILKSGVSTGLSTLGGPAAMIAGSLYESLGNDPEKANKYYRAALGESSDGVPRWDNLSYVHADEQFAKAVDEGDWMNMKKYIGTPEGMSPNQAIVFNVTNMLGELASMAATGGIGRSVIEKGLAENASPVMKMIQKLTISEGDIASLQAIGAAAKDIERAKKTMLLMNRAVRTSLEFMDMTARAGHGEEIPMAGLQGLVAGVIPRVPGNLGRVINGLTQTAGMTGTDFLVSMYKGKSLDEIKQMYKEPEYWINMSMMTLLSAMHKEHYDTIDRKLESAPKKEVTPKIDLFKKEASVKDQLAQAEKLPEKIDDIHPEQLRDYSEKAIELMNKWETRTPEETELLDTLISKLTKSNPYASTNKMMDEFISLVDKNESSGLKTSEALYLQRLVKRLGLDASLGKEEPPAPNEVGGVEEFVKSNTERDEAMQKALEEFKKEIPKIKKETVQEKKAKINQSRQPKTEVSVPQTGEEPFKGVNVIDEIKLQGSDTVEKIRKQFPEANLTREQARALRNQAFPEKQPLVQTKESKAEDVLESWRKVKETKIIVRESPEERINREVLSRLKEEEQTYMGEGVKKDNFGQAVREHVEDGKKYWSANYKTVGPKGRAGSVSISIEQSIVPDPNKAFELFEKAMEASRPSLPGKTAVGEGGTLVQVEEKTSATISVSNEMMAKFDSVNESVKDKKFSRGIISAVESSLSKNEIQDYLSHEPTREILAKTVEGRRAARELSDKYGCAIKL